MPYRLAEFAAPSDLAAAIRSLRAAGYSQLRAFTPFAAHEVDEALAHAPSRAPLFALAAGVFGCAAAFALQWWCNAYDMPLDVGGRPLLSIPAWVPIAFEATVLGAAGAAFVYAFASSGLPRLHDPIDALRPSGKPALAIALADPRFVPDDCAEILKRHGATRIVEMEAVR